MNKMKASVRAPILILAIFAMILLSRVVRDKIAASGEGLYLSLIVLQLLIFIIPTIIFCRLRGVGYSSKLNLRLFSPGKIGCVILGAFVLIAGSILIRIAQAAFLGLNTASFSIFESYMDKLPTENFLFSTMTFVAVPAITEEFVFRSVLLSEYNEDGYNAVTATIISSLLSSLVYFNIEQLPIFILCGIVCCIVTYVTASSLAACLTHLIFNLYGIFGEPKLLSIIKNPSSRVITVFTATVLLLILTIIFISECEHILYRAAMNNTPTPSYRLKKAADGTTPDITATENDGKEEDKKGAIFGEKTKQRIDALLSPTFLICILIYVVAVFGFK